MRRPLITAILTTALLAAAAACASPMPIDPEGPDPGERWPEGREFWSTAITEDGAPKTLVEGTRLTVRFGKPGELQVHTGCNQLGIRAHLEGDRIKPFDYISTAMGCMDTRAEQDKWVQDFFTAGPSWSVGEVELMMLTEHITIRFTDKEVLDPDRPLAGPHWVVTTIISDQTASSALPDNAYVEFTTDGDITGRTGCATLTGTSIVEGNAITVGPIQRTERPCEGAFLDLAAELDQAVMATLKGTVTFTIDGPRLTLRGEDGNGLSLSAAS